jgi:hypothetical protein
MTVSFQDDRSNYLFFDDAEILAMKPEEWTHVIQQTSPQPEAKMKRSRHHYHAADKPQLARHPYFYRSIC